jgi:hypothetical protein
MVRLRYAPHPRARPLTRDQNLFERRFWRRGVGPERHRHEQASAARESADRPHRRSLLRRPHRPVQSHCVHEWPLYPAGEPGLARKTSRRIHVRDSVRELFRQRRVALRLSWRKRSQGAIFLAAFRTPQPLRHFRESSIPPTESRQCVGLSSSFMPADRTFEN